jgi:hypothetical protein
MRAWINLTTGDYHGVVAAARNGTEVTPHQSVAVQLFAQEAKAWARIGDRRQTEVALDKGRRLLESLPYPENLDNHFVVDPTKFDYYAMDCYRILGVDTMAENLANEVIQASTDFDGQERAPMRLAEARTTLGVVRARQGDPDVAVELGLKALSGERKSLPSLLMVSRDLTKVLKERYPANTETGDYLDQLATLTGTPAASLSALGPPPGIRRPLGRRCPPPTDVRRSSANRSATSEPGLRPSECAPVRARRVNLPPGSDELNNAPEALIRAYHATGVGLSGGEP